jgi:hypothetical protein
LFAEDEPAGDPGGLGAFGAAAVKEVGGAVELQENPAEGFEFGGEFGAEGERFGSHPPIVAGEKAAFRELAANGLGAGGRGGEINRRSHTG